ncbi:hypothetical protein O0I10_012213 [Lichtheimia ornata]|uniref:SAP domain-containing protein n=1 Tax=Lichtheimia ornata TaxID=688661 RepID=A0AAD7UTF0_9FUNG|nr:uncharacterized protein O0I10_012213 [Lichtheimia ornata]KAJ8652155.1 hypothetical protein O0I10_012213 [Lichtheimia ornata]
MPTSSNSNHPQPQPIQQSTNNSSILFPFDNATSSQQPSSSYDPFFSMTGQDTYMDDFYKHLGSWSNQDAATTQQLLASSFEDKQQQQQQQQQQDPSMFFSLGNQQDILLSDPNFVRQQQLLQEQQRATMQREALQQQDFMDDADISNASVMFDDMEDSFGGGGGGGGVGMDTVAGSSAPMDIHQSDQQQIRLSYPDTMPTINTSGAVQDTTRTMASAKPIKKDNRRSPGMRLKRTSSPIPINASGSAAVAHATRSSEIDHQRRQNELQARFRVNYNKKTSSGMAGSAPKTSSTQQRSSLGAAAAFGTSVPTIPTTRFDESTGAASSFPAGTSPLQVGSFGNGSTSGMMKGGQATSFPSRTMPIQIQRVQRPPNAVPFDAEEHQRQLDDQLEKVDFDDITVSELKDMLRQRGKPATGKKVVLVQRLQEERELIKAIRSGKIQRHSQPPPPSSRPIESARPRSFQASSPMAIHAAVQQQPPQSPMLGAGGSSSSVPNSSLMIPGSPNSVTMSLNRMHIGSPPMTAQQQHPRRFSPYATPSSPRLGSSSPKPQNQQPPPSASYSSSVPTNALSSSPGSFTFGSPLSSSFTNRFPQQQRQIPTTYGRPKSYAPFTSSALATPDRDDDHDPFDDYKDESSSQQQQQQYMDQYGASSSAAVPVKMEMDPTIESVLYGANTNFDIPEGFTEEDLAAVLAGQGFGNLDMHSNNNDPSGGGGGGGFSSNDMALFDNHVSHATPR